MDKAQRVAARSGQAEQLRRMLATRIGERAFWEHQDRLARAQAEWGELVALVPADEPGEEAEARFRRRRLRQLESGEVSTWQETLDDSQDGENWDERVRRLDRHASGRRLLHNGAIVLGTGALVLGIGIPLAYSSLPGFGWVLFTVGGILFIAGLIVLLVAASRLVD
jgi:hypothetical protein